MSLALKIALIILTTLLGVFPSFFTIVNNNQGNLYSQLNTEGRILVSLIVVIIILNIVVEVRNNKESDETKQILNNIQTALTNKGLQYDSTSKTIISRENTSIINIGTSGININAGGNAQIRGNQINGNQITKKYNGKVGLDYYKLEETIKDVVRQQGIIDKDAYLVAFKNTSGKDAFPDAKKVLLRCGFAVFEGDYTDPIKGLDTRGFKVFKERSTGKLVIAIGNPHETEP